MPKQTTNKKVVTSTGGRKISTPMGLLFIVAGALLLAVGGTYGYTKYKERDLQAKAASLKSIEPWRQYKNGSDGVKFSACREYTVIGPDEQQNKPIRLTIIASKPATLGPATQSGYSGQPTLHTGLFRKQTYTSSRPEWKGVSVDQWREAGGGSSKVWWGNVVTVAQTHNVKISDKIAPYVISKYGNVSVENNNELFNKGYNTKYVSPPWPELYKTPTEYKAALKTWNSKFTGIAKLPNCK